MRSKVDIGQLDPALQRGGSVGVLGLIIGMQTGGFLYLLTATAFLYSDSESSPIVAVML